MKHLSHFSIAPKKSIWVIVSFLIWNLSSFGQTPAYLINSVATGTVTATALAQKQVGGVNKYHSATVQAVFGQTASASQFWFSANNSTTLPTVGNTGGIWDVSAGNTKTASFAGTTIITPSSTTASAFYIASPTLGGTQSNTAATVAGNYYTFNIYDTTAATSSNIAIMQTTDAPRTIIAVSQSIGAIGTLASPGTGVSTGAVAVTITLSSATSVGDNVYLRYSTTGFANSGSNGTSVVAAVNSPSGSNTYVAIIPAQVTGTTVSYYAFTSTFASITGTTDKTVLPAVLRLKDNSGSYYAYTTSSANDNQVTASGATTGNGNFSSLNAAFAAINAGTLSGGNITLTVNANITEPTTTVPLAYSGLGSASYTSIKIVPATTGSYTIRGNTTTNNSGYIQVFGALIDYQGASNVTVDGDPTSAGTKRLTFQQLNVGNTSSNSASTVFYLGSVVSHVCNNDVIQNCNIIGGRLSDQDFRYNYGIISTAWNSGQTTGLQTNNANGGNTNTTIRNNNITRAMYGIYINGQTTAGANGLVIQKNTIGSATVGSSVGIIGIYVQYSDVSGTIGATNGLIDGNDIRLGDYTTGTGFASLGGDIAGINVGFGNTGLTISNNNIHDIVEPNATSVQPISGIYLSTGNTFKSNGIHVFNNYIGNVKLTSGTSTWPISIAGATYYMAYGIHVVGNYGALSIDNNTVVMPTPYGSQSNPTSACIALPISSQINNQSASSALNIRNNIFVNSASSTNAIGILSYSNLSGITNFSASGVNNNDYYLAGGNVGGYYSGGITLYPSIAATSANLGGIDANSISANPVFTTAPAMSGTNTANWPLYGAGIASATVGVSTDIIGTTRATNPCIGAYEFSIPTASITGSTTACPGAVTNLTVTYSAGGAISGTISNGTVTTPFLGTSPVSVSVSPSTTSSYTITSLTVGGVSLPSSAISGTATITMNTAPTAGITGTTTGCGSVSLTATGGATYAWSGGSTPSTAANTFTSSGTYTVTVTNSSGCTATASTSVTVNTTTTASITGITTGCGSVSLTVTGAGTYTWTGGSSPSTAANTFTSSGTYTVTVTSSGCSATASASVTVNTAPTAGITGTATGCGSVSLTATGGSTYAWSGGGSPSTASNTFTSSGIYTVTVSNSSGCTATASQVVTVNPVPTATASNTGPYIPGQTISLSSTPSGLAAYAWSGPQSFTASTQNATRTGSTSLMSGTYTLTVTNSSGCTATASTFVSVNALGDYVWTGAISTNWTTPGNWSPTSPAGGPSGCTQNVIIPNTVNDPVISSSVSIGNVTINDNAQLTLNGNLSVCQNFTGGTTAPVLIVGTAHLIMSGSAYQAMSGNINANYVEINNTSSVGVGSTATLTINKGLIQTKGIFANQGGSTILVSNAGGDAYLDNFTSSTAGPYHGNLTVQRYISNTADGYRDLSSSVGATVANLNNAFPVFGQNNVHCWYSYTPYPNVQTYVENQIIATGNFFEHWNSYTSLTSQLYPMRGISARTYVGAPYTINLTGLLYANNESATITHTTSSTPGSDGWNFIGNPYPSPIKWSAVKAMNGAVTNGSYYVYHTTAEYAGNWASFNGTTGVNGATDYIASSQGFFVQTATASSTFSMNNTVRTIAPASFFSVNRAQDNEVRLVLDNGVNNDEIVSYTDANATAGFDADLDAVKMPSGSTVSIGYSLSGKEYAINVMDVLTPQTVLPLAITVRDTGSYTLSATTLNTPGLTAYLHDAVTGTLTDLSAGAVQMKLNGGQNYSGRYSVVFRAAAATGIANTVANTTRIYSYGSKVYVQRSSASAATITVTNLLGQQIKELPSNTEMTIFDMPTSQPWYALIKVKEGEKTTVAKVLLTNN